MNHDDPQLRETLYGQAFYEVMQAYRHAPRIPAAAACEAYEAVRAFALRALTPRDGEPAMAHDIKARLRAFLVEEDYPVVRDALATIEALEGERDAAKGPCYCCQEHGCDSGCKCNAETPDAD